jgi:hypothetical protein
VHRLQSPRPPRESSADLPVGSAAHSPSDAFSDSFFLQLAVQALQIMMSATLCIARSQDLSNEVTATQQMYGDQDGQAPDDKKKRNSEVSRLAPRSKILTRNGPTNNRNEEARELNTTRSIFFMTSHLDWTEDSKRRNGSDPP